METATLGDGPGAVSRFGVFTFDARRAELHRGGAVVALRPKTYALLSYLAAHPGRVVAKEELLAAVWPGVVVNDESLSQCVRELRGALGDEGQALIRTVPRRGYLFDPVEAVPPAVATRPAVPPGPRAARWLKIGALLLAALALLVRRNEVPLDVDKELKARRSVAVLPFVHVGGGERSPMADAIAAGLVTDLAKLPDTPVIDRASAAAVRETDVRRIGRELGARHVLTGSAQRDGNAVRIHAQLASSEDGTVLWSERFDYADVADGVWLRDLGSRIARVIDWRLGTAAAPRAAGNPPRDPVDEVLQGQHLLRHWVAYDDLLRARAHFQSVLAVQPRSAAAWTGVAESYVREVEAGWNIGWGSVTLAEQAIARARAVDPGYLPAHAASGGVLAVNHDAEGALRVFQTVVAADPSDAWAHARIGAMKQRLGRLEEVRAHADAALRLAPFDTALVAFSHLQAGFAEYYLGHDEAAYEHMRLSIAAGPSPSQVRARMLLASLDALHGRGQEAREHAAELLRLRPRFSIGTWRVWTAPVHPRLQALRERFLEGLAKAGLPE
jgi:TolB-like protein